MVERIVSALRLENDSKAEGENWWKWWVWVEGTQDEIAAVKFVTYRLHPSFRKPVQDVYDASTKFRLTSAGWGEFTITADAHLKSGESLRLERWLQLQGGAPSKERLAERRPSVFVSYSVADNDLVSTLRRELLNQGVEVWTDEQNLEVGSDWRHSLKESLHSADMVVALISDPPSRFVEEEALSALAAGREVVPVVVAGAKIDKKLSHIRRFELSDAQHVPALANRLAAQVKDQVT
jgi:hypothetical protein